MSQQLGQQLLAKQQVLATAESCTAGGIAYAVTTVPGSSAYFDRGFVTYSNQAKQEMLAVPADLLQQFGAVSEAVAKAMAEGALANSNATIAIATTGIAGPGGGSADKPVGLVGFALAQQGADTLTVAKQFSGDREQVREQAIAFALEWLLQRLS